MQPDAGNDLDGRLSRAILQCKPRIRERGLAAGEPICAVRAMRAVFRLAYPGDPGAFAEAACALANPDALAVAYSTPEAAIDAVRSGDCDAAVLPVHNSVAGPVEQTLALLPAPGLREVGHVEVAITMALLALPGVRLDDIRTVTSHPVALAQCSRFLATLGARSEPAPSTATAAAALARSRARDRAVLAAPRAAVLHGLVALVDDVGDDPDARTRFVVLEMSDGVLVELLQWGQSGLAVLRQDRGEADV